MNADFRNGESTDILRLGVPVFPAFFAGSVSRFPGHEGVRPGFRILTTRGGFAVFGRIFEEWRRPSPVLTLRFALVRLA
jgi:hypothetical protein